MCPQSDGYGATTDAVGFPASDLAWCRQMHDLTTLGGIWGVPQSGLIFTKNRTGFALSGVMPWSPAIQYHFDRGKNVPPDAKALLDYQRSDFECIRSRFVAAGFTCTDPRNLLGIEVTP